MKILQLISSAGYYGAEAVMINLTRALVASGVDTRIAVIDSGLGRAQDVTDTAVRAGLPARTIRSAGKFDKRTVEAIRQIIAQEEIDVVHSHGYKSIVFSWLACRGRASSQRAAQVATYHSVWPDRGLSMYMYEAIGRTLAFTFPRVAAVSDTVAQSLRRTGFSSSKVHTIPNGIDLSAFDAAQPTLLDDLPAGKRRIGVVGRLIPLKGHTYFLAAAAEIRKRFNDVCFVIVGDGPERERLEAQTESLGIASDVLFTGVRSDMPGVYASLDICVLPSLTEGLPMAIIEALASRRPVVASRVGGIPVLIRHRETGLLSEPGDTQSLVTALSELLADPAAASAYGAAGSAMVREQYSAATMASRYCTLYDQAIQRARR